jgi:hypothetical protein
MGRPSDRDRLLLEFAAQHRLIAREHAQALLSAGAATATRTLRRLADLGLMRYEQPFNRGPGWWRITRKGLRAIGSELGPPRPDLGSWRHDLGLAWLHLAGRAGLLGDRAEVVTERTMRSHDARRDADREPGARFGVPLGGYGRDGQERLHYPDLVLVDRVGRRVAVELELSRKSRDRRASIMLGYARERRLDAVLYLVESPSMARSIRAAAAEFGLSDKIHVQYISADGRPGSAAPVRSRVAVAAGTGRSSTRRGDGPDVPEAGR